MSVENEGTFFHPNTKEDSPANGLTCFLDGARECGPDCMAYQTFPPEGPDYQEQQWAHCQLLVNAHRVGKHLTILAASADAMLRRAKTEAADRVRQSQPTPPTPKVSG